MELPFYQLLKLTAEETGLEQLFQAGQQGIMLFFALLALAACFAGFKIYRPFASFLVLTLVILGGYHWLCPAWGLLKGITFCAVIGCCAAVLTFLNYQFSAKLFSALVTAGFLFSILQGVHLPLWVVLLLAAIPGIAAAVLTHFFPFWSVTGFTALWGAVSFFPEGLQAMMNGAAPISPILSAVLAILMFAGGWAFQLFVFRKQQLFKEIMPAKFRYMLEQKQKQNKKGGSVVA